MMTQLDNARTLHKHFLEIGRLKQAKQLEVRFPVLVAKPEVPKDGKKPKR